MLVPTPTIDELLSVRDYHQQCLLAKQAMDRASISGRYSYMEYFARFGLLRQGDFGRSIFVGMCQIWQTYRWNYRFRCVGTIYMGWFALPQPFSKAEAERPMQVAVAEWYPCFFQYYNEQCLEMGAQMACLNLVELNSKPWWVHYSRCVAISILQDGVAVPIMTEP